MNAVHERFLCHKKMFDKIVGLYYTIHIKAMIRISSNEQSHTEKCRLMRGLWKTRYEYLFELHTERSEESLIWRTALSRLCRLIFVIISGMNLTIQALFFDSCIVILYTSKAAGVSLL